MYCCLRRLLYLGDRLHNWMRSARREKDQIMIELLLLGTVTVALLIYLVYALLLPERF